MNKEFKKWWKQANDGANTADKDTKFPLVKELAMAAYEAGQKAEREACIRLAIRETQSNYPIECTQDEYFASEAAMRIIANIRERGEG